MVVGFNHNFRYKGVLYHVQTEDGGLKSPQIVTLLYRGGNILSSKKTSYADITRVDHLGKVVEELMKDQHREMLRRLKDGEFDAIIEGRNPVVLPHPGTVRESPPPRTEPSHDRSVSSSSPAAKPSARKGKTTESSLDEIILSYLSGDDERDD